MLVRLGQAINRLSSNTMFSFAVGVHGIKWDIEGRFVWGGWLKAGALLDRSEISGDQGVGEVLSGGEKSGRFLARASTPKKGRVYQ